MFVGHYAFGLLLKKKFNEISLWLLFVAVQLVDILAFIFVLLGIERIRYNPSPNPFLRTIIEYVPFTHSLFGNAILAGMVFLLFWKLNSRRWASVLAIGVLSHWFLDVLVHTPDMPLFFDSYKVGLGLWHLPILSFAAEIAFLLLAGIILLKGSPQINRYIVLVTLLVVAYGGMFFAPEAEAKAAVVAFSSLTIYSFYTALAYWCERRKA